MTDVIRTTNLIMVSTGFIVSLVGLVQVLFSRNIEKKTRYFFYSLFSVLELYTLCILIRELTHSNVGSYGWVVLSKVVLFGQAFFASVLTVLITAFLLFQTGEENWIKNKVLIATIILWLCYQGLLISNIFTGSIYEVDDNNVYSRGPMFAVLVVPTIMIMIIDLFIIFWKRKKYTSKQIKAFLVYSILPMMAMIIQTRLLGVHLIALSSVLATFFMLICIISDQNEKYYKKEAENAQLKINILLAQIQPHFLYNSLTTIKYLCAKDSKKAEEALDYFISYLRYNVDSLSNDAPIEFEKELEHVKGYLELQKLRFGDDLEIEYDIETTDFKMPTLTLQPLVENAVNYGVRKNEDGQGIVKIITRKKDDHVEVIVEDNGPGFVYDPSPNARQKLHVGVKNVMERIARISGGELSYESEMGKGTRAIIKLYK